MEFELREEKKFKMGETFGIEAPDWVDKATGKTHPRTVTGFASPGRFTPEADPNYIFPKEETRIILASLEFKDRTLLVGPTGCGKSTIIQQIAARLNYNVIKIAFDGNVERQHLVGQWLLKGKRKDEDIMEWVDGMLTFGMKEPGTIILLDEWDTLSPDAGFVLQSPLDKNDGTLLLLENHNQIIKLHPQNAIMATANTNGQGDDTGSYLAGTKVQNFAQLNRFGTTILMNYLEKEHEVKMLESTFKCSNEDATKYVDIVNEFRKSNERGEMSVPVSTRDLRNWFFKFRVLGKPILAARYSFINRMTKEDRIAAEQILQRYFGSDK